jgi:hypothetical protein
MNWHPSIGARVLDNGVFFRVWAPDSWQVEVVLYEHSQVSEIYPLTCEDTCSGSMGVGLCRIRHRATNL